MKAPRLDLHRPNRPDAVAGLIALVVGIVAVIAAMQYRDALKVHGEALDERESLIAQKEAAFKRISQARRGSGSDTRAAILMAQQRYAAEPARDLIEGGWNPNIAFLSIDITTASRQINLRFETRSVQEALSYADWFQEQPGTENVSVKRQTQKEGPPARSVETALQVTWKPFVARPLANEPTDREVETPAPSVASAASAASAAAAASAPGASVASVASVASGAPAASKAPAASAAVAAKTQSRPPAPPHAASHVRGNRR